MIRKTPDAFFRIRTDLTALFSPLTSLYLKGTLADIMAPYDVWRHFYVAGGTHTVFFTPQGAQNDVSVRTFITQMVTDDPAWATVQP